MGPFNIVVYVVSGCIVLFVLYPTAFGLTEMPYLWTALYFVMIILMGIATTVTP